MKEADEHKRSKHKNSSRAKRPFNEDDNILMVFEDDVFSALPSSDTIKALEDIVAIMRRQQIDFYYLGWCLNSNRSDPIRYGWEHAYAVTAEGAERLVESTSSCPHGE